MISMVSWRSFLEAKKDFFSRFQSLTLLQRFNHTLAKRGLEAQSLNEMDSYFLMRQVDRSKWRKWDARDLGIRRSMIPDSPWAVLNILKRKGFEAYLVGGCVRDLLLNKIPKDFDVITTAQLDEVQRQFHRAMIIGRRYPICTVHIKGSIIEVCSFNTLARNSEQKENFLLSQMPSGCNEIDIIRWRNSMHRDFTINSLFLDPFVNKIYDYTNGMEDIRSLKLRTLVPAHLSFKEDCARILRGLRIAARLGLSFSRDTETAMHDHSSSILSLGQVRIMMELNYMLSYGSAAPSISLLRRFNLLGTLFPFHAAYLNEHARKRSAESSMMLMKLFSNMDKLISCDQPADSRLWIGLLAFHLALVSQPQNALVIWAFAFVLYHGKWTEAVKSAREHAKLPVKFVPEISESSKSISDEELAEEVSQLVSLVQDSVSALTDSASLLEAMSRYPAFRCFGHVFVPKRRGRDVAQIFDVLVKDIESYENEKKNMKIDYYLLGRGAKCEIRFVLGKIILETMRGGLVGRGSDRINEENHQQLEVCEGNYHLPLSDITRHQVMAKEGKKRGLQPSTLQQVAKKQRLIDSKYGHSEKEIAVKNQEVVLEKGCNEMARNNQNVVELCQTPCEEINATLRIINEKKKSWVLRQEMSLRKLEAVKNDKHMNVVEKMKHHILQDKVTEKQRGVAWKCNLIEDEIIEQGRWLDKQNHHISSEVSKEKSGKQRLESTKKKGIRPLSSLFK